MADQKPEKKQGSIQILINWDSKLMDDLDTIYANQFLITHAQGEFYLVFGETFFATLEKKDIPNQIKIKPVAKIALTPEVMMRITAIINENVNNYKAKSGIKDDTGNNPTTTDKN